MKLVPGERPRPATAATPPPPAPPTIPQDPAEPLGLPTPFSTGSERLFQHKMAREALRRTSDAVSENTSTPSIDTTEERIALKTRMFELIGKLRARTAAASAAPAVPAGPAAVQPSAPSTASAGPPRVAHASSDQATPGGRLHLAQDLYRSGEIEAALRTLQMVDPAALSRREAALMRYMQASCYRRLGDLERAKKLYKELVSSKEDEFLAECAAYQIHAIQTREEAAAQLATIRKRSTSK